MSLGYVLRRLLSAIPLLLGISVILFAIIHLAPGGPLDMYTENPAVSKEALAQIAAAYGLDQPVPVQYFLWLKSMLVGDWGYSIRTGRPVLSEIVLRLGPTLELGGLSLLHLAPWVAVCVVLLLSRDAVLPRHRSPLIAPCTTTIRGLESEGALEPGDDPVPRRSAVNLDSVESVSLAVLVDRLGRLRDTRMRQVCAAPAVAVDCAD